MKIFHLLCQVCQCLVMAIMIFVNVAHNPKLARTIWKPFIFINRDKRKHLQKSDVTNMSHYHSKIKM